MKPLITINGDIVTIFYNSHKLVRPLKDFEGKTKNEIAEAFLRERGLIKKE